MMSRRLHASILHGVFILSGISALIYQLVWQRALLTIYGSNVESVAMVVAAFEGEATTDGAPRTEALAMFLGPSPTPALLEAEGARAVALARERQVEALEGPWACGDIAIYAWDSARNARRQLVTYSSGQRGRAMLIPTLPATRSPAPIPSYLSPFISAVA